MHYEAEAVNELQRYMSNSKSERQTGYVDGHASCVHQYDWL